MKTLLSRKARKVASALLVALVITTILSVSIMSYLTVVEQQSVLGARSQTWNMAIAVVEAGIEEGLEHLQSDSGNLGADGWTFDGQYYVKLNNVLPDGSSYDVKIDDSDPNNPTVLSRANVTPPTFVKNRWCNFMAAIGVPDSGSATVRRAVRVRTSKGNLFTAPLVAKHDINLNGNGVYTDSYDSTDSSKSKAGQYDLFTYSGNKGDIATNGGITNSSSVSIGNANIYGIIHVGGPEADVAIGPNGGVGPHGSQVNDITSAKSLGYILEDANFTYPDTSLPADYASYLPPTGGTVVTYSNSISATTTNTSVYPDSSPWGGLTTNTSYSSTSTYPNPVPPGMTTNITTTTSSTYPNPAPAGLTTNAVNITGSSTLPSPVPAGTTTNYVTTLIATTTYPANGTYVGSVSTFKKNGDTWYSYNEITGYTYNYTTYTYSYPTYTYIIPNYSYSYSLYATNVFYYTNTYDYVLNANTKYLANSLSGSICVLGPNVTLVMPNGLTGAENFTFNQGASVLVYSGGNSVTINGTQYLNPNFYPSSFIVYCTPSVTSFTLNGNGQFTGVLVAPNADLQLNGGGKSNTDFCGCLMVDSATMNGHFSFHYDESLSHMPSNGRYLIAGWDEIDPATF